MKNVKDILKKGKSKAKDFAKDLKETVSEGEEIDGAWFTTEKGGRIFFAKDEDGNLP